MPKTKTARAKTSEFLLEIGIEELPVTAILSAIEQLQALVPQLLREACIEFGAVQVFAAPRRIGLLVTGLAPRQRAESQELTGPSTQAAFDAQGQPTPACLGFVKRHNATPEDVQVKETPRGAYVVLQRTLPALPTERALPALITALTGKLQFPKMMRWHLESSRSALGVRRSAQPRTPNSEPRTTNPLLFPRPVRWLVALYGARVIAVTWGGVVAGRTTRAHRAARSRTISIPAAGTYAALLRQQGIIIDPGERRAAVQRAIESQLKTGERLAPESLAEGHAGGIPLVDEVAHLVESPAAFRGTCAQQFATLPREILIASMAKYQRIFAIEDKQGKLLPAFIAVTNGKPGDPQAVRRVYETILGARLSDSLLFYQQDLRTPLDQLVPHTAGILVHRQVGNMQEKTRHLEALVSWIAETRQLRETERKCAQQAAQLCKADLVSHVVYEFPSLQGIMGGIYHLHRYPDEQLVAEAIQDQYMTHRPIPRSMVGIILALADRVDTLVGFAAAGVKPTGSVDPFGLRRSANELLELLENIDHSPPIQLTLLIDTAITAYGKRVQDIGQDKLRETVRERLREYLLERWKARQNVRYDLVRAVLAAGFDDVGDALARIKALEACVQREPKLFAQACKVSERTRNIVRAVTPTDAATVDPAKFTEALERDVWKAVEETAPPLEAAIRERRYADALQLYARTFSDLLERFFTKVLVNAEDPAVRANRLALLKRIDELIRHSVADLTQVVLESASPATSQSTKEAVPA